MIANISTDILNQTELIQQIIDTQSITDSYQYFMDKLISAAKDKSVFLQGIYCYALASLLYKHSMYSDAMEYADKSLSYFIPLANNDKTAMNFLLWIILELGYINCANGNIVNAEAMLSEYEQYGNNDIPLFVHHYLLLKTRINQANGTFIDTDIDEILKYKKHAIVRRHFPEYNQILAYLLTAKSTQYAEKLLNVLKSFSDSVTSNTIKRLYWASVSEYYKQSGDESRFAEAFAEYEQQIIARKESYRQIKLDTITSKERVFHQNELKDKLKNKVDTLKKVSHTDSLTGLPNRYFFNEYGQEAFEQAIELKQSIGIILIDIDNFKHYNDTYGHLVGDQCLALVGKVMNTVFSEHFVARYGGDEFISIVKNSSVDSMMKLASKLKEQLKTHTFIKIDSTTAIDSITVSQGIVCITPDRQHHWPDLFHAADTALYTGKINGRNNITHLPLS